MLACVYIYVNYRERKKVSGGTFAFICLKYFRFDDECRASQPINVEIYAPGTAFVASADAIEPFYTTVQRKGLGFI
jgi:hypothetical protein